MADLFKRTGSDRWYAYIRDPRCRDGLQRVSTGTNDKRAAREFAKQKQAEVDAEIAAAPAVGSGLQWLAAAERYLDGAGIKPTTRYGYASLAGIVARSNLGDFYLNALTHDDLRAFVRERRASAVVPHNKPMAETKRKVKDSSIRRALSFISTVYQWLIDQDQEDAPEHNPLATFDRSYVKESKPFDRHLRPIQFEQVLKACKDEEHRRIVIVLVSTGMRTSELLKLQWGEVDWKGGYLEFGNLDPDRSKTHRARRIPLLDVAIEALTSQKTAQFGDKEPLSDRYIFPSPVDGEERYSLSYLLKVIKRRTGIKAFRIYDLRHTFASWLLQQGADPLAISRSMGHSTLVTTTRYAHHVSESAAEQLRRANLPVSAQFTAQSIGLEEIRQSGSE